MILSEKLDKFGIPMLEDSESASPEPEFFFGKEGLNDWQHSYLGSDKFIPNIGKNRSGHAYTALNHRINFYIERYGEPNFLHVISDRKSNALKAVYAEQGKDMIRLWSYVDTRQEPGWRAFEKAAHQAGYQIKYFTKGEVGSSHGFWLDESSDKFKVLQGIDESYDRFGLPIMEQKTSHDRAELKRFQPEDEPIRYGKESKLHNLAINESCDNEDISEDVWQTKQNIQSKRSLREQTKIENGSENGLDTQSQPKSTKENTAINLDTKLFWRLVENTEQKSLFSQNLKVVQAFKIHDTDSIGFRFWIQDDQNKTVKIALTAGGLASLPADAERFLERYEVIFVSIESEFVESMQESEYQGRKVTLDKPFRTPGGPKKFAVYTKGENGDVVIVKFGDPEMEIKRDDPERRKNYRARHHCENPGPKWKANYWSCKMWSEKPVTDIIKGKSFEGISGVDQFGIPLLEQNSSLNGLNLKQFKSQSDYKGPEQVSDLHSLTINESCDNGDLWESLKISGIETQESMPSKPLRSPKRTATESLLSAEKSITENSLPPLKQISLVMMGDLKKELHQFCQPAHQNEFSDLIAWIENPDPSKVKQRKDFIKGACFLRLSLGGQVRILFYCLVHDGYAYLYQHVIFDDHEYDDAELKLIDKIQESFSNANGVADFGIPLQEDFDYEFTNWIGKKQQAPENPLEHLTKDSLHEIASSEDDEFNKWLEYRIKIDHELEMAQIQLKKITGDTNGGLTSDAIKATPEYKAARVNYQKAFEALRQFNGKSPKDFMRRASRIHRGESCSEPRENLHDCFEIKNQIDEACESRHLSEKVENLNVHYHTVMANITDQAAVEQFKQVQNKINPQDYYSEHPYEPENDDGRETDPHTTVFYGIKDADDYYPISDKVKNLPPLKYQIGNVSAFRNDDKPYDVLKVEVFSKDMSDLHYWIRENFENGCTFPWNGHITLGYINKGACKELEGPCEWTGAEYSCSDLIFSDKDDGFSFMKTADELDEAKKAKVEITDYSGDEVPKEAVALIPSTDALKKYINKESGVVGKWVAKVGGKVVGLSTLEDASIHGLRYKGNTEVIQVFVSPKARGMGVGEALIKEAYENKTADHVAGYVHHSDAFGALAKKYGIRDMDDVSNYDEESENWQDDGTYDEPMDESANSKSIPQSIGELSSQLNGTDEGYDRFGIPLVEQKLLPRCINLKQTQPDVEYIDSGVESDLHSLTINESCDNGDVWANTWDSTQKKNTTHLSSETRLQTPSRQVKSLLSMSMNECSQIQRQQNKSTANYMIEHSLPLKNFFRRERLSWPLLIEKGLDKNLKSDIAEFEKDLKHKLSADQKALDICGIKIFENKISGNIEFGFFRIKVPGHYSNGKQNFLRLIVKGKYYHDSGHFRLDQIDSLRVKYEGEDDTYTDAHKDHQNSSVDEGANGDWKKEGIKIKEKNDRNKAWKSGDDWIIEAIKNGKVIGYLRVYDLGPNTITSSDTMVQKEFRRMGIATALYQYAEKVSGKKMVSAEEASEDPENFSSDAEKLWSQPKRPFGEAYSAFGIPLVENLHGNLQQVSIHDKDTEWKQKNTIKSLHAQKTQEIISELTESKDSKNLLGTLREFYISNLKIALREIHQYFRTNNLSDTEKQNLIKELKSGETKFLKIVSPVDVDRNGQNSFRVAYKNTDGFIDDPSNYRIEFEAVFYPQYSEYLTLTFLRIGPRKEFYHQESIGEGANGDWKQNGIVFKHEQKPEVFRGKETGNIFHTIVATDPKIDSDIGIFEFFEWGEGKHAGSLDVNSSNVAEKYQRIGIASEAYRMIEKITGLKVANLKGNQSSFAKALWSQPKRPFGESYDCFGFPLVENLQSDFNYNNNHDKVIKWQTNIQKPQLRPLTEQRHLFSKKVLAESKFHKQDLKLRNLLLAEQVPLDQIQNPKTLALIKSWLQRQSNQEIEPVSEVFKSEDGIYECLICRLRVDDSPYRIEFVAWNLPHIEPIVLYFNKIVNKDDHSFVGYSQSLDENNKITFNEATYSEFGIPLVENLHGQYSNQVEHGKDSAWKNIEKISNISRKCQNLSEQKSTITESLSGTLSNFVIVNQQDMTPKIEKFFQIHQSELSESLKAQLSEVLSSGDLKYIGRYGSIPKFDKKKSSREFEVKLKFQDGLSKDSIRLIFEAFEYEVSDTLILSFNKIDFRKSVYKKGEDESANILDVWLDDGRESNKFEPVTEPNQIHSFESINQVDLFGIPYVTD